MLKDSPLKKLQSASSLSDVAYLLKVQPKSLSYHLYIIDKQSNGENKKKYAEFTIPKKGGGDRKILAPNMKLKFIQSQLSKLLYKCIEQINSDNNINGNLSYGYTKGKSIFDNAKAHKKRRYVFNIDLKNFFDSINFGRVRGFFIKNRDFNLDERVATVIAQIACYDNNLPQGSPSSPVISNLIGHILDIRLSKLAKDNGCSYSRYCDDITFSTNKKIFPKRLAYTDLDGVWNPSKILIDIIIKSGFEINTKKVRMSYFYSQQRVTGLTVNKKVNTPRKYRDTVRSLVHNLCHNGDFEFRGSFYKDKIEEHSKLDSLQGMLNYIARIDYENIRYKNLSGEVDRKRYYPNVNKLTKSEKTFRNFILFRYFFNPSEVTIFGEGKTDKAHLQNYLKYRELCQNSNKAIPQKYSEWKDVIFYNFESRIFDTISTSGGTADIKKLVNEYEKYCVKFHVKEEQNPTIILVDDDEGSSSLLRKLSKANKKTKNEDIKRENFYFIAYNLYVVFLPRLDNKDTEIESFYPKDLIDIQRKGLYFECSDLSKGKRGYSKQVFATEIVPNNHTKVDWSNFDPIFRRIQYVIDDFEVRSKK